MMQKTLRLAATISFAATLGLTFAAVAQPREQWEQRQPGPGGRPPTPPAGHPGPGPAFHPPGPPVGHPGPGPAFNPSGPPGAHPGPGAGFHPPGAGGPRFVHPLGERGYSFRGPSGVRREIVAFSPREHEFWRRGRWHHEMRFGRYGYWYEVNGAWYFYDQPFDGPPTFVSEVEFVDPDLDADGPDVVVEPAPPVIVVPPAVCVGPLCVR